ncbi:hypothetical protein [Vibrio hepatarius]
MNKTNGRKPKSESPENHDSDKRKENIHEIRKKIENILLEREQKKLWDL